MSKVVTANGNFSKGQIDHDLNGRFELPAYTTGMDIFKNWISNYKGNAMFASGFLSKVAFQDCAFIEFKFGITQNYLCVFYAGLIRFLAFDTNGTFGWVESSPGVPLEVVTGYTLAEAKEISLKGGYTQNADVMYITHRNHPPSQLRRTAANAFTFQAYTRTADPFTGAGLWPGVCSFYKGRMYMGSTNNQLTTLWMSNVGAYDDFTVQSPITDASGFSFTIADITQQIENLYPGDNSLIALGTDGIVAINGGGVNTAITPETVQANLTSAEPSNGVYPVRKENLLFYVGRTGRNVYYFKYDILTESFTSNDTNLAAYDITRSGLQKMRYKHDRDNLIYSVRGDNDLVSFVFQEKENINGWHDRETIGSFTDIGVIGDNNGNPQMFALVNRSGTFYIEMQAPFVEFKKRADFWTPSMDSAHQDENSDIDQEAYLRYVSEQLRGCVYLDNALTYQDLRGTMITFSPTGIDPGTGTPNGTIVSTATDFAVGDVDKHIIYKTSTGYESGRFLITGYTSPTTVNATVLQAPKIDSAGPTSANLYAWSAWYKSFKTVSGLDQYNSQQIGIVTDGGFLDETTVSGGSITLPNQTASIVVGLQYTGLIKSMCMGFSFQGKNTQITFKEVNLFSVRSVATMGVRVGTSLYDLNDVQLRTSSDINYLPPSPIDGTLDVEVTDDSEEDKFFYIVQDQPLPATITNLMITANYSGG